MGTPPLRTSKLAMATKAPQPHICFGSVCCEDYGGERGEREGIVAVDQGRAVAADSIEVMAERGEPVMGVTVAGGDQPVIDTVAASGGRAAGVHVPRSLPPSPLQDTWDRAGANYEETRKLRMMQALVARDPTEKGLLRATAPSNRHVTGIAPSTRAPSSAPVAHRLARLASYQWRNAVDNSIAASAAAPLGARDDRREPKVSAPFRDETRVSASSGQIRR